MANEIAQKKDIGDSQRAQFKGPEIAALGGNITSDGSFIESRILGGKTLAQAFHKLREALKGATVVTTGHTTVQLLLITAADIVLIESYAGVEAQLVLLQKQYDALN